MSKLRRIAACSSGALVLAVGLFPALRAEAAPVTFGAVASANQEVTAPGASDLNASAVVDISIDGFTGDVCVQSTISGLGGAITAAHIHSGGFGVNGAVVVPLPNTATAVAGCVTTTPQQAQAILANPNGFYFNAHTAASPGGAVRGQLTSTMLSASLVGSAEVPTLGDPDGSGRSVVSIDTTANQACVWTELTALDLPAVAAHIHSGALGVAGPVVVPIVAPATATAASCGTASAAVVTGIAAAPANFYVNVHTAPFPGGAVRGNLTTRTAFGIPTPATGTPIPLATTTTVLATTTVPATTTIATTTTAATTTTIPTTTTTAPAAPATTAAPAVEPSPAEPIEEAPTFAG